MASRDITVNLGNALEAQTVPLVFLAKFEFPGGAVRYWSGLGEIDHEAETYTGLGDLGTIDIPEETTRGIANGISFSISGVPTTNTSLALSENYRNKLCTLWVSVLDSDGTLIDPYVMFKGLMDVMEMEDDGQSAAITLRSEAFAYAVGPENSRWTAEHQKRKFPGDLGFDFVAGLQDKEIIWGSQGDVTEGTVLDWGPPDEADLDDGSEDGSPRGGIFIG